MQMPELENTRLPIVLTIDGIGDFCRFYLFFTLSSMESAFFAHRINTPVHNVFTNRFTPSFLPFYSCTIPFYPLPLPPN